MFIHVSDIQDDYTAMKFIICGYEAVDTERQLAVFTTNGRVKNARKWIVQRYTLPSGRLDRTQPHFRFRATEETVMQRLAEPGIQARIDGLMAQERAAGGGKS